MEWPGRLCRTRPSRYWLVDRFGKQAAGSAEAADAPGRAAGSAASAAAAAAATASAGPAAAATAATAATATPGELYAAARLRCGFLVEEIKRRQADVGDFFFTERERLSRREIRRLL